MIAAFRIGYTILILSYILACATCEAQSQAVSPPAARQEAVQAPLQGTVCINGWVGSDQARYIELAAQHEGFAVYHEVKYRPAKEDGVTCSVYFIRGDADTWLHGKHRTYTFKGMSLSKAVKVLREWGYWRTISAQCCVNNKCEEC